VKFHDSAGRGSDTLLFDDLGHLECRRGFGRCQRWSRGRDAGLGRGSSSLLWS
jgi:hypothetical protein